jgi:4-amino-4-deoxy-L-arabinose transferase-like glycosyltransferase
MSLPSLRVFAPPAVLALAMAALIAVVPPAGEFPINDDWNHAGAARSLFERGRLEVAATTSASLVLQAFWGSLFAHLFGFSFTTLRASTLVLAFAAVAGCYVLLRDLLDPWRALLGALLLLFNPLFVNLSYSFMTDVPFLALAIWALVCYARALRGERPSPAWLAAGSALSAGAFLIRQPGAMLPLAALLGLLLTRGARAGTNPIHLMAVLGPLLPALLVGAYFDAQRGPIRQEPLRSTLDFWSEHGPGMLGVVLARLAAVFSTLGLFALAPSLGALAARWASGALAGAGSGRSRWPGGLSPWWVRVSAGLLLTLLVGFVLRSAIFEEPLLFPHLRDVLTERGFLVLSGYYNGTLPESIVVPSSGLALVTVAAMLGAALFALGLPVALTRGIIRGPAVVPLLFGLLMLGLVISYHDIYDRYVLAMLPSVLLIALIGMRLEAGTVRRKLWGTAITLVGIAILATWSIWWEREYLERRAALWKAGLALVERGIPSEEIDGGFEWNGWHRRQSVVAAALRQAQEDGTGRRLNRYVNQALHMRQARWTVAHAGPEYGLVGNAEAIVPYWRGQYAVALRRY